MRDLSVRALEEEQMDDPALPPEEYEAVLADLGRVNRWTFAARPTLGFLERATRGAKSFTLLDVGYGEGGMLRAIAAWARKRGIEARLTGVDLNSKSEAAARVRTPYDLAIDWRTGDYQELGRFDFVVSSLVAHHMNAGQLTAFLRWMEAHATGGWLINDLHRRRFAYAAYPLLARLLGVHRIVREDGQLSIARAYRPAEWRRILQEAEVSGAKVVRRFPFRLCVERLR